MTMTKQEMVMGVAAVKMASMLFDEVSQGMQAFVKLDDELTNARGEVTRLEHHVSGLEHRVGQLNSQLSQANEEISRLRRVIMAGKRAKRAKR